MGSFKGVKEVRQQRGGRRGGGVSQEKFNKTISHGGGAPDRVLERCFTYFQYSTPLPVL